MVQTGELTRGFMQQNRPSRNRPTHIWSIEFLTKLQGEFKEEMLKWGHAAAGDSESVSHSVTSDFLDCGPPHSSVHGILQARILEWVAISFSRGSSRSRNQTRVSCIACSQTLALVQSSMSAGISGILLLNFVECSQGCALKKKKKLSLKVHRICWVWFCSCTFCGFGWMCDGVCPPLQHYPE